MPVYIKYGVYSHEAPVNSQRKQKASDSMFLKLVGDTISQIKKDQKRNTKKIKWYYLDTEEQVLYIKNKLIKCNIEIIIQKIEDGYRIRREQK